MTAADITLFVFTTCNSLRVLAYLPQITRAAKDRSGAEAISFMTWALFLFSHASAVAYALVNTNDWTMAVVFGGNAIGCAIILLIGAWKRARYHGTEDAWGTFAVSSAQFKLHQLPRSAVSTERGI